MFCKKIQTLCSVKHDRNALRKCREGHLFLTQCTPFIALCLGMDHAINESCYEGTMLQIEL